VVEADEKVSYLTLLRNGNFFRFFVAQFVSSLGDWVGVLAIAILADRIGGPSGIGIVMTARVLPGFFVGPLAGVIADRFDRKKTMIIADLIRAGVIFSLPFFESLPYLLVASVILESLTLVWGPAKDASMPNVVPTKHLIHANSLSLLAVYGAWPLASLVFAALAALGGFFGDTVTALSGLSRQPEALALWMDSLSFLFSAAMIASLTLPSSRRRAARLKLSQIKDDLFEGLRFVAVHKQVRPWLLGIGMTFTAAGAVFSLGVSFVDDVLGGSEEDFAFVVGFLATGMIFGLLMVGVLSKIVRKDILFSSSLLLLGVGLIAFASASGINAAVPLASALGFFGGCAYSTGYSLIHETTSDELRGRTFSAAYTVIRIGTLVGLGLFPLLAGAIGDNVVNLPTGRLEVPGTRATLWVAGLFAGLGGIMSMRAIGARNAEPWPEKKTTKGYFVVFEGGEGAGKSTQMSAFVRWLEARGEGVVTTREPGGTAIGDRIRKVLLDTESAGMDARAEALLYAADRAQHVSEVIRPALDEGKVVVSDRFVDSSLAYQGIARGLGLEEIYRISQWGTGGIIPDLVFFLKLDPEAGLARVPGTPDRLEQEAGDFHRKVGDAYAALAKRFAGRFVIVDADGTPDAVHKQVVDAYSTRMAERLATLDERASGVTRPVPR
jgi:dTMP kinase